MTDYLGTDGRSFFKGTAGLRDVNGLISLKAILKYRHGSFAQVDNLPPIPQGRPRRIDNRNSVASIITSNPAGARACLRVQNSRFTG